MDPGEETAISMFVKHLEAADEQVLLAMAEAVSAAFRHQGLLPARATEFDAEIAAAEKRRGEIVAQRRGAEERYAAEARDVALRQAIARTRPHAGPDWVPGRCSACGGEVQGWDAGVGTVFSFGVKFLCDHDQALADAERAARANEAAQGKARRKREEQLAKAWKTIPEGFGDLDLARLRRTDRVKAAEAIAAAERLVLDTRPSDPPTLLLVGDTGSGKTTLALALASAVIGRGEDLEATAQAVDRACGVRFFLAASLARARERAKLGAEAPDVCEALDASLLVIDELGGEPARLQDVIEEIVTARSGERRMTIITTGLSGAELTDRYTGGFCRKVANDPRCRALIKCGATPALRSAS